MSEETTGWLGTVWIVVIIVVTCVLLALCFLVGCGLFGPCSRSITNAFRGCMRACCGGDTRYKEVIDDDVGLKDNAELPPVPKTQQKARQGGMCCGMSMGWVVNVITCGYCCGLLPAERRARRMNAPRPTKVAKVVSIKKAAPVSEASDVEDKENVDNSLDSSNNSIFFSSSTTATVGYGSHLPLLSL